MIKCQNCNTNNVITITAKHNDTFRIYLDSKCIHYGYNKSYLPITDGCDCINMMICISCGQIQGDWNLNVDQLLNSKS